MVGGARLAEALGDIWQKLRLMEIVADQQPLVRGEYGRSSVPISEEIKRLIIGDEPTIDCRPADLIPPQMDKFREEIREYIEQDEDVLSYAIFPQVALDFFKFPAEQLGVRRIKIPDPAIHTVNYNWVRRTV